jgi:hypothetical protein
MKQGLHAILHPLTLGTGSGQPSGVVRSAALVCAASGAPSAAGSTALLQPIIMKRITRPESEYRMGATLSFVDW